MANKKVNLEATAYHEAGHVVIAQRSRILLERVTIDQNELPDGLAGGIGIHAAQTLDDETLRAKGGYDIARDILEPYIRVCLAGRQAQSKYNRRSVREGHSEAEIKYAKELIQQIEYARLYELHNGSAKMEDVSEEMQKAYLTRLCDETDTLLGIPVVWEEIKSIANALLEQKTLSSEAAKNIMTSTRRQYLRKTERIPKTTKL
jgi:ATP-dependent Zn protease